jgi:hypothetical protein
MNEDKRSIVAAPAVGSPTKPLGDVINSASAFVSRWPMPTLARLIPISYAGDQLDLSKKLSNLSI